METQASSTDNYDGCKHNHCLKRLALSRFAVDGNSTTCFLSLKEYHPWFLVKLDRYHPIALIHVVLGAVDNERKKQVFVAGKNYTAEFLRCGLTNTRESVWSIACKTDAQNFMWGNGVKITGTDNREDGILHLCEVQIYAETYANIALKHRTQFSKAGENWKDGKTNLTAFYGHLGCFKSQWLKWRVIFGTHVRVAMVSILLENSSSSNVTIGIVDGRRRSWFCTRWSNFNATATYLPCVSVRMGTEVWINKQINTIMKLCDVEIFQTTIVNLAAGRPTYSPRGKNPELGVNQLIDRPFHASGSNESARWCVDLLVPMDIHLVRIITDVGYKRHHLTGLKILVDKSKIENGSCPEGTIVAELRHPTKKRVQSIVLPENTNGRVVSLHLPGRRDLRFREVEIYNGALPGIDECTMPGGVCDTNFECVDTENSYSCVCRGGFKYEIQKNLKRCVDIDDCAESNPCPIASSYCRNTVGSYHCLCTEGYERVFNVTESSNVCQDINECDDTSLSSCPNRTECVNLQGNYTCECTPGYESTATGKTRGVDIQCEDMNECLLDTCGSNSICNNTRGSFRCKCKPGFQSTSGDGKDCSDINECNDTSLFSCPNRAECVNLQGSYTCECTPGYESTASSKTRGLDIQCEDINECDDTSLSSCPNRTECVNLQGNYTCECAPAYESTASGKTRGLDIQCEDINECERKTDECHMNATCTNLIGSYSCACPSGLRGDGKHLCTESEYCQNGACSQQLRVCKNIMGTEVCECKDGYKNDYPGCADINECLLDACGSNSICNNTRGSFRCKCKPGFQSTSGDGKDCSDINECNDTSLFSCPNRAECVNLQGSYTCECTPGYESTASSKTRGLDIQCEDINECEKTDGCHKNATCTNLIGSYSCACPSGMRGDGKHLCTESEYCQNGACSQQLRVCKNIMGTEVCECKDGYKNDYPGCADINECELDACGSNSICNNTRGSFRCKCKAGFQSASGDGKDCSDINECDDTSLFSCPNRAECVNLQGSYTCECTPGYGSTASGKTRGLNIQCEDINECEKKTDECHKNANCTNLIGSYSCACPSGLRGDGKHLCTESEYCQNGTCSQELRVCKNIMGTEVCECKEGYKNKYPGCTDINECLLDACGSNSICNNTRGSFRCKCIPGFQSTSGDGKDCSDVNECAKDNLLCGSEAKCKNKPATYECVCKKGFSLHKANKKCLDTDECKEDPDICGPHTICRNVPGSYDCSCKEGFTSGEGELQCKDIDECANNKYKCNNNSSCENIPGSFICKCKSGFRKNHKGKCEEKCSEDCPRNAACVKAKCKCLPGYRKGPYNECYDMKIWLPFLASGPSLQSSITLTALGAFYCVLALKLF
ncbi:fibrillin-1-like [Acropora muricata]|uniref:fibrillin-1-like n=1 Tax=Acropora muricata TaxID=159855 RepID=UPI0034E42047